MEVTKNLIQDIVEVGNSLLKYSEDETDRPEPGPPATPTQLAVLETHLREKGLPFRQLPCVLDHLQRHEELPSPHVPANIELVLLPPSKHLLNTYPSLASFIIGRGDSSAVHRIQPGFGDG